jgi:hypothetical protein
MLLLNLFRRRCPPTIGKTMKYLLMFIFFILGFVQVPAICWLLFVYPYGEVSIKRFVISFGVGAFLGLLAAAFVLTAASHDWPKD